MGDVDQPRDEMGRWTSGGGGGAAPIAGHGAEGKVSKGDFGHVQTTPTSMDPATPGHSIAEAKANLDRIHGDYFVPPFPQAPPLEGAENLGERVADPAGRWREQTFTGDVRMAHIPVAELMATQPSVSKVGVTKSLSGGKPILAVRLGEHSYAIWDGHHRSTAAYMAGEPTVYAAVHDLWKEKGN
jgi:hypothetical protein